MTQPKGPILFDLDDAPAPKAPADAPPVPEVGAQTPVQAVAVMAARPPSRLARWFWALLVTLIGFVVSIAAWRFVTELLTANPMLGWIATGLVGALILVMLALALRELAALSRLRRIDGLRQAAAQALDLKSARQVTDRLSKLYAARADTRWGRDRLAEAQGDVFDASAQLALAETAILAPLDTAATREIEAAARQVATVTALVPLALADVVTALTANLRMIRRIAEIYGGRGGTLGSWRLARGVLAHLVATGAVAVGDDLIGSVAGGGVLSKLSRRFGEGVINGALTARVGVAAMQVCRPLPFAAAKPPSVTGIMRRSVTGLFGSSD